MAVVFCPRFQSQVHPLDQVGDQKRFGDQIDGAGLESEPHVIAPRKVHQGQSGRRVKLAGELREFG
jgi:hypothetical protein